VGKVDLHQHRYGPHSVDDPHKIKLGG
jgi:hypothetical protein